MNSRSTRAWSRHCVSFGAGLVLGACISRGCGGIPEISYLFSTEAELLEAPEGTFAAELARLTAVNTPPQRAVPARERPTAHWHEPAPHLSTVQIDIADVRAALAARGSKPTEVQRIGDAYAAARNALETWLQQREVRSFKLEHDDYEAWHAQHATGLIDYKNDGPLPSFDLPPELPVEFVRYFAGAVAWHQGKFADARAAWLTVTALPEADRRYRSTWAAYMLARSYVEDADKQPEPKRSQLASEGRRWSRTTREWAAEGLRDPLGLAAASYGWEARAALTADDQVNAISLYLQQRATGDDSALESLRRVAPRALYAKPEGLESLARDANARGVITAYLISRGRNLFSDRDDSASPMIREASEWATALKRAGVNDQAHADRLAWTAYEGGLYALAAEWAALSPEQSGMGQWLRAQLALRSGNLREGDRCLRAALDATGEAALDAKQRRTAFGELTRTDLALDRPAEALTAALEGDNWTDVDYIAERVLSLAELRAYVDADPKQRMRVVLALRLARNGRVDLAVTYFEPRLQPIFRAYVEDVRIGFDAERLAKERAAAFWRAAQSMQENRLLGATIEAEYNPFPVEHRTDDRAVAARREARLTGGVFATTPAELARIDALPAAERNFRHYRYRAAELAWWAAALLPNDSEETAKILATAGGWLKARDPVAAEPFYQALVIRCSHTELGRAAIAQHWLPKAKRDPAAGEL